jgi:hypothetical protein
MQEYSITLSFPHPFDRRSCSSSEMNCSLSLSALVLPYYLLYPSYRVAALYAWVWVGDGLLRLWLLDRNPHLSCLL